ncbi:transposase [Psychrobium sp. MM17-31]|uniref:transposase n=1 Tax=Psychrobium sp. MM17-31 TaxID=2917758 RepID=UPI001EF3E1D2|nr:transposase [Psychrobium sp. MM17-31]MCG7530750.1 transposase [Psychrobium sp. MM17-31]
MARARNSLIDLDATPFYHVISRCVRRAFLCGEDKYSGKNYNHRRQWVLDKLHALSGIFAIHIAAYAIMSNHYHLVLRVDRERALSWSDDEVIERWYQLHKGHPVVDRYRKGEIDDKASLAKVAEVVSVWRFRLYDISWFMRHLNESIARAANKEDNCKGRYWEGRYYSQALLDEQALLSCMMYVDLNPIRAGMANDFKESDFTSIQARIRSYEQDRRTTSKHNKASPKQPANLLPFGGSQQSLAIPFTLYDYFELADWSARQIVPNKRGFVEEHQPKLLDCLGIASDDWIEIVNHFRRQYGNFAGSRERLRQCANEHHHCWYKGVG